LVVSGAILRRSRVLAPDAVQSVIPGTAILVLKPSRDQEMREPGRVGRPTRRRIVPAPRAVVRVCGAVLLTALAATAAALRLLGGSLRRGAPIVARRTARALLATSSWLAPRLVLGIRRAAAGLVWMLLVLVAVAQGIALATWTYWTLVVREAARRRAAT
jgi:hypothetical protein